MNLFTSNTDQQLYPYTQSMAWFKIDHPYAIELAQGRKLGVGDIYVDRQGHGYVKIGDQTFEVCSTNIGWLVEE